MGGIAVVAPPWSGVRRMSVGLGVWMRWEADGSTIMDDDLDRILTIFRVV
jgi:hypothetical protein